MTVLVGLLEDKLFDLGEKYAREMNALLYGDGVADPKALAGLKLLVADDPSIGTVGGINRATAGFEWWRNRARTAAFGVKVSGTPALGAWGGGAITSQRRQWRRSAAGLQSERRQLTKIRRHSRPLPRRFRLHRRHGEGDPGQRQLLDDRLHQEPGRLDGIDELRRHGGHLRPDARRSWACRKRAYWFDTKKIMLMVMEDEWMHKHTPARPYNQFLMYRSITTTCQLIGKQFNQLSGYRHRLSQERDTSGAVSTPLLSSGDTRCISAPPTSPSAATPATS